VSTLHDTLTAIAAFRGDVAASHRKVTSVIQDGTMTPDQMREALSVLRWSQGDLAAALNRTDRQVRRWLAQEAPIPRAVSAWLRALVQAHQACPAPTLDRVGNEV
jgi:hypothetical protein